MDINKFNKRHYLDNFNKDEIISKNIINILYLLYEIIFYLLKNGFKWYERLDLLCEMK